MAALDQAILADAHGDEHVAAACLNQRETLPDAARLGAVGVNAAFGQAFEDLIDQPQTLLDLTDADPYARVDIAVVADWHLEFELVIRRISHSFPRVEGTARSAADIAAGSEGARQGRCEVAGGDGAVLQRGGVVVDLDHARETATHRLKQRAKGLDAAFV